MGRPIMNKFTYYIKMNSEDLSDFDPNLELAVKDIIKSVRVGLN